MTLRRDGSFGGWTSQTTEYLRDLDMPASARPVGSGARPYAAMQEEVEALTGRGSDEVRVRGGRA